MKKFLGILTSFIIIFSLTVLSGCKVEWVDQSPEDTTIKMVNNKIILNQGISNYDTFGHFLKATEKLQDYHIVINSFGGASWDCISIVNRIQELQNKGAHITTEVYGFAMSAGAVIFLTGDTRIMHTGAALMFHCARVGNFMRTRTIKSKDLESYYKDGLQIIDDLFINILREKTVMSEAEIQHWMYFEDKNFMTDKEAKRLNVATKLI